MLSPLGEGARASTARFALGAQAVSRPVFALIAASPLRGLPFTEVKAPPRYTVSPTRNEVHTVSLVCTVLRAFFGWLLIAAANATPHASKTAKLIEANSRMTLLIPNSCFNPCLVSIPVRSLSPGRTYRRSRCRTRLLRAPCWAPSRLWNCAVCHCQDHRRACRRLHPPTVRHVLWPRASCRRRNHL